ncbi:hypothetical protein [Rhodococcoides fascians]|uniref:hypothetical protein n=1 Tax=Rhodococcoides fascians TaxID=1828 RepID=UPI0012D2B94E|nr:hypothetical protein [Rhodococcus fascians]
MSDFNPDPYTRDSAGRLRNAPSEPVHEYEASGRFRSNPYGAADPAEVAALMDRLDMKPGQPFDLRRANPIVDQWEMHQRFAESFSPGHQRLENPGAPGMTLGELLAFTRVGNRRRGGNERSDVEQQLDDPFDKRPALAGSNVDGWVQLPVSTVEEVTRGVVEHFAPKFRKDSCCGFCFKKQIRLRDLRFLLRGHSFWIHVHAACVECQTKLQANADRIGVQLSWIDHPDKAS